MKKSLYGVSMLVYAISLILTIEQYSLAFFGYYFIGSFAGSDDYGKVLTIVVTIAAMLFHTLAVFKNKKYIYVTRAILLLGSLFNLLVFSISMDMLLSLISSLALLSFTFIEKTEYVITNTVSEEELAAVEKEISDEKTKSSIGNIIAFIFLPIIFTIVIIIGSIPFSIKDLNEFKEEYRSYYPSVMATDEQNAQFDEFAYLKISSPWQVNTNHATAMLESKGSNDYWIINDNINIVLNLYYDTWDSVADETILVNVNYGYPDMQTDKISKICIGDECCYDIQNPETYICPDFTDEEKEILRDFVLNEKYLKQEKITLTSQQRYNADFEDLFWCFEGEDTLYLEQGEICKLEDGKYYFYAGWPASDFYVLPDAISQKLVQQENKEA